MSSPDPHTSPARRKSTRVPPAIKHTIIAAVAAGMTQREAAEHFGYHPNTIYNLCKVVKKVRDAANPFSKDYQDVLVHKAHKAAEAGMDAERDPYKRAGVGIKWLEGKGILTSKVEVENDVRITIEWGTASSEPINVTPTPDSVEPQ